MFFEKNVLIIYIKESYFCYYSRVMSYDFMSTLLLIDRYVNTSYYIPTIIIETLAFTSNICLI